MPNSKITRDTKQRRLVYEVVMHRTDHPTADAIYRDVYAIDPKISRATVYRNLKVLSENGDIRHIKVPGTEADRYDFHLPNHYHILCTGCGKVTDTKIPYHDADDETVAKETGFHIARHRTVFEGVCPECLKKLK